MKVHAKYTYPEQGTLNGRIYPQEILEKAFDDPAFKELCLAKSLPINDTAGYIVGIGTAHIENSKTVIIDAEIFSPACIKAIKAANYRFGLALAGYGTVAHKDEVDIVTDFIIDSAQLCEHPAIDCFIEIQEQEEN